MRAKSHARRKVSARKLDLNIKVLKQSVGALEWGCAYAFPVRPEVAVPLVVVSALYQSPRTEYMGGPDMAPHTPPTLGAPRLRRGAPRPLNSFTGSER